MMILQTEKREKEREVERERVFTDSLPWTENSQKV